MRHAVASQWLWICLASLGGCAGTGGATDADTDRSIGPDCDGVPESFCFLWDVSTPCEIDGYRTYRVAGPLSVSADGSFSGEETWYKFYPPDRSLDKVDTVTLSGTLSTRFAVEDVGCSTCELALEVGLEPLENDSGWLYSGKRELLVVDRLGPNGEPFEDDAVQIHRAE